MDKKEYQMEFVKPSDVLKKRFHSSNVELIIQKMIENGFIVLECQPIKKEEKNANVLLREM